MCEATQRNYPQALLLKKKKKGGGFKNLSNVSAINEFSRCCAKTKDFFERKKKKKTRTFVLPLQ